MVSTGYEFVPMTSADLPLIVKPSQPISLCAVETEWSAPGKAPPLLYRPPIA